MPNCQTCRHFRPYQPLSQGLSHELGIDFTELVSELMKMMQDERQRRDEEAGLKLKLLGDRAEAWPYPPSMSSWCAVREDEGVYLLFEVKNRGQRCTDHAPAEDAECACQGCVHRRAPTGPDRDAAVLHRIGALQQGAAVAGQKADGPTAEDYRKLVGTRRALEAAQAYYAGKMTHRPPEYLSVCGLHSTARDSVPCVVQNPYLACPDRQLAADPPAPAPGTPTDGPPQPGAPDHDPPGQANAAAEPSPTPTGIPLPDWG